MQARIVCQADNSTIYANSLHGLIFALILNNVMHKIDWFTSMGIQNVTINSNNNNYNII